MVSAAKDSTELPAPSMETLSFPTLSMETLSLPSISLDSPSKFAFVHKYYDSLNPSNTSTPFVSAPSSPGRNYGPSGFYYSSAPTSPNWALRAEMMQDTSYISTDFTAVVPFSWEEKPGTPKKGVQNHLGVDQSPASLSQADFEFSARFSESEDSLMSPTPANELFLNGQIRPLRPPPRLQQPGLGSFDSAPSGSANSSASAPLSPRSPLKRSMLKDAFCGISDPGQHVLDPFTAALEEMKKERGKEHHRTRSLSPLRIFHWDEQPPKLSEREELFSTDLIFGKKRPIKNSKQISPTVPKRWTLKKLLHRSTGEQRKGWQRKESWTSDSSQQSNGSGRSDGSENLSQERGYFARGSLVVMESGDVAAPALNGGAMLRSRGVRKSPKGVSSHGMQYAMQRAQTDELRKKTFLHHRHGWLGCLGFTSKSYRAMASNISQLSAS